MNDQLKHFNRQAVPLVCWLILYGLVWLTFVVGADVPGLVIGALVTVIMLWKHQAHWLLLLACAAVAGLLFVTLEMRWPEPVLTWLLVGTRLL